uniref:Uncharacterized protein n=1 Tax=Oryza nivara TaxID=4536 RepID=A0A0E0IKD2_ORYNI
MLNGGDRTLPLLLAATSPFPLAWWGSGESGDSEVSVKVSNDQECMLLYLHEGVHMIKLELGWEDVVNDEDGEAGGVDSDNIGGGDVGVQTVTMLVAVMSARSSCGGCW